MRINGPPGGMSSTQIWQGIFWLFFFCLVPLLWFSGRWLFLTWFRRAANHMPKRSKKCEHKTAGPTDQHLHVKVCGSQTLRENGRPKPSEQPIESEEHGGFLPEHCGKIKRCSRLARCCVLILSHIFTFHFVCFGAASCGTSENKDGKRRGN